VTLTSPAPDAVFTAPATFAVTAEASDVDGSVTQVEFFANGTSLGIDTSSPYSVTAADLPAGSHSLLAIATDDAGTARSSSPVGIVVAAPGAQTTAAFLGVDASTQGTWTGTYGADGHRVIDDSVSDPSYAEVTTAGMAQWTWASSTADVRALQRASGAGRLAATWYGQAFTVDVKLIDGLAHTLSIYAVDWDSTARAQRFDVRDAQTNELLDSRTISDFNGGRYLVWRLTGHVRIDVTRLDGVNAVVSGVFFDPGQ
jgi:hypothetical protein